jgi:hypothetical protein
MSYTLGGDFGTTDVKTIIGAAAGTAVAGPVGTVVGADVGKQVASGSNDKGGLLGSMGGLCGCANKDKQAEDAKRAELAQKYPDKNCGATPDPSCTAYNEQMKKLRDAEFDAWKKAKDKSVAKNLSAQDKQKFAFAKSIAEELKYKLPSEAGSMTLSQISKKYPAEFAESYAKMQKQFPFLAAVPAELALALNPDIANMTLDQLIEKTGTMSADLSGASMGGGMGILAIGGAAIAGLLGIAFIAKRRK